MKLISMALCATLLAACGQGANDFNGGQDPYLKAVSSSPAGQSLTKPASGGTPDPSQPVSRYPVVRPDSFNTLANLNFAIATEYIRTADQIRKTGRAANGVLIFSAVMYGVGSTNNVASNTLANGLIYALGLSEGLAYSGTSSSAKAFLLAADQSTCIASRALAKKDGAQVSMAEAAMLWEVTYMIQTDLRRALSRKNVNILGLATGLLTPKDFAETDYQLEVAKQKARAAVRLAAVKDKDSLEFALLGCLVN